MASYSLGDFERIKNEGFVYTLPPHVLQVIQSIADQVGAPEYIKTPQFHKKEVINTPAARLNNKSHHHRAGGNKAQEISDEDWDAVRRYQATVIVKKNGIEASIEEIRKHLNKMSKKTYEVQKDLLMTELQTILASHKKNGSTAAHTSGMTSDLIKVSDAIFSIASGNIFYSDMYATLYKELMNSYDFMQSVFERNFEDVGALFKDFSYIDPAINYDGFCETNKTNDRRRALSQFYVNLMKEEVIAPAKILTIVNDLQCLLLDKINEPNEKNIVDELSEVLYIFIVNGAEQLNELDDAWDGVLERVRVISQATAKQYPSITTKTIFKHMDILENV